MRLAGHGQPDHVVARLGQHLVDRIDGVEDFVFRLGVGVVRGKDGFVEQNHDARSTGRHGVERIINHGIHAAQWGASLEQVRQ